MKRPVLSFRARIALLSAAISGVVLAGFGTSAWVWLHHERLAAMDREIRTLAYRHPGWMNNRANYERLGNAIEFIFGEDRKGELILLATSTAGAVRFQSSHWPREIDPASLDLNLVEVPRTATTTNPASETSRPAKPTGPTESAARSPEDPVASPEFGPHRPGGGPRFGPGAAAFASGLFTRVPRFLTVRTPTRTWRLGILGNDQDRLVVGLDCGAMNAELLRLRTGFFLALPVVLGLIGGGGWWVAGQAVRPLRRIARAAEQTTARGLDQRIPSSGEDPEIDRLVTVLNRMMDRLQASFRQATRFSADASHELKTPLAVMQGELEAALQSAEDGSGEQRVFASLLDETRRLTRITRSLLLLAQADSGQLSLALEALDLADELEVIAADARILAESADLEFSTRIPRGLRVSVDRVLVRLAVSNLVDNAIHYNQPGGRVELTLDTTPSGVRLEVANTGPGIPAEEQPRVFDRFHRGRDARGRRGEGMGLGASLAREIALAHRGDLVLVRSDPDRTVFRLTLPPAPHSDSGAGIKSSAGTARS